MRYQALPKLNHPAARAGVAMVMFGTIFLICLLAMAGCQPKVESPISGKEVTPDQLVSEAKREEKRLAIEMQEKADAAAAKIRDTQRKALVRANAIAANVDQSKAEADRLLAELRITTEADVSGAVAEIDAAKARFSDAIAALEADTNDALAEAERKRQQAMGILGAIANIPVVGQAAASVGIDPVGIGALIFGGGTLAYQVRRGRKLADQAWEDAKAEANAARDREDKIWDEAQKSLLLLHSAPPSGSRIGPNITG